VGGLFAGVLGAGLSLPRFLGFYDGDARGAWTLPALLHLPYGHVVLGVVIVALVGFAAAEAIERRGSTAHAPVARVFGPAGARLRMTALMLALMLAGLAAIVRTPVNPATAAAAAARAKALYKPPSGC
jgi:hypothetical protein